MEDYPNLVTERELKEQLNMTPDELKEFCRHVRYEQDFAKVMYKQREISAAQEAEYMRKMRTTQRDGLGQCIGLIPAKEFLLWHMNHPGCWEDKQFIKEFLKDNPNLKV